MPDFLERLRQGPVLCDGAMGTQLYARRMLPVDHCFDELNLSDPELVKGVHLDYIQAGAEVIETNTFGANRLRLAAHGLADKVHQINAHGVALAREARRLTGQMVWIAGAVGPLGKALAPLGPVTRAQARKVFREQIAVLAQEGADVLILETFSDLQEIKEAIAAAQEVCPLPIVAQLTFTEEGRTTHGDTPEDIVTALEQLGIPVIGGNCSVGSEPMLRVMEQMAQSSHTPLSAQPNAGFPTYADGRFVYLSSPDYMAEWARRMVQVGVRLIGGCCGTTPDHIAAMRDAIHGLQPPRLEPASIRSTEQRAAHPSPVVAAEPTGLAQKLGRKFVVTVEVDPPKGFDVSGTLQGLRTVKGAGLVDAINVADSPRAQGRMSALAMASLIQTRLGMETILHLATRHRNLVALHSELLGAHALGVRNILTLMGDVPRTGDYPDATAVSDITASGLIRLITAFNQGVNQAGKPIEQPTSFFAGCAFNMAAPDLDKELRALERKVKAGAHFIITQAVYSAEAVERCRQRLGGFPLPLVLGVLPLRSHRHAEFLHHEVPGIVIPEEVRRQMQEAGRDAPEQGIRLARELLKAVHHLVAGVYFIVPFQRYEVVSEVLEGLTLPEQRQNAPDQR